MNAVISSILSPTRRLAHVGFADWLARGVAAVRAIGPYVAIEIILPGGTILAFLLWLHRRRQRGEPRNDRVEHLPARLVCETTL